MELRDLKVFTSGSIENASVADFEGLMRIRTALKLERCGLATFDGFPSGTVLAKQQLNLTGSISKLLEHIDYIMNDYLDFRAAIDRY